MAYIVISRNGQSLFGHDKLELQVETRDDIDDLPNQDSDGTKPDTGSVCIVEEDWSLWVLCSDKTWHEVI
jgi:hypothetical protein